MTKLQVGGRWTDMPCRFAVVSTWSIIASFSEIECELKISARSSYSDPGECEIVQAEFEYAGWTSPDEQKKWVWTPRGSSQGEGVADGSFWCQVQVSHGHGR